MTDADALLAAITAAPDDDLPRLVYADFLDERGDSVRAEFIRVQCASARLTEGSPELPALLDRAVELLTEHRPQWIIPGLRGRQLFRRGFVETVGTTAAELVAVGDRAFAGPVRSLRLYNAWAAPDTWTRFPGLARLDAIDLTNGYGSGNRLMRFFDAARLDRLTDLTLRNADLWPDGLRELSRSAVAARLTSLNVSGNRLSDDGAAVLAVGFPALQTLIYRNDELPFSDSLHAAGLGNLTRSQSLTHLKKLDLNGHYIGDAGLAELAGSTFAAGLREVFLGDNDIGALGEGAYERLVESPYFGQLQLMDLGENSVNHLAAKALANWRQLASGMIVDLRGCDFETGARDEIRQSPWASQFLHDDFSRGSLS